MRILAIETSCDETGAAVVEKNDSEQFVRVLSNVTATSSSLHAKTGGIIPETASREQVKAIIPVIIQALLESENNHLAIQPFSHSGLEDKFKLASQILKIDIDAIAVTHGPGLIGSLLVGVETAKTLSYVFSKPIIPVHHLLAHIFANFIQIDNSKQKTLNFPFTGLIVSGGHTDLLLFESISKFKWLGGTRDDAAGEALDKIGRLLGLPYPAGPEIEKRASKIARTNTKFQSPLINSEDFDFSFSGLKTEISRFIATLPAGRQEKHLTERLTNEICYALQDAIFKVLIKKTIRASKVYNTGQIALGGGVSANITLREQFKLQDKNIRVFSPPSQFATDNAAMIGAYALLNPKPSDWHKVTALPDLYFD